MDTIGLKVKTNTQLAVCIKVLRRYTKLSMGEIKEKINNGDYVYECSYIDSEGINEINKIYKELSESNIEADIYEHGRLTNIEFVKNLSDTYCEIDDEINRIVDEEADI